MWDTLTADGDMIVSITLYFLVYYLFQEELHQNQSCEKRWLFKSVNNYADKDLLMIYQLVRIS